MDPSRASIDPTDLVRDLDWLAGLARRIVRDPGLADDAVQEAWMAASRRAGAGRAPARQALAGALRGILKQSWRTERRRRHREEEASRPEALLSAEEVLLIGERQQLLWRHLAALREPFRSTLLRRFHQGTELEALAAQEGVSTDAIRWRIRRGIEMLRDSLEKGSDGPGVAALAPLAALSLPTTKLTSASVATVSIAKSAGDAGTILGAATMQKTIVTMASLLLAILIGAVALLSFAEPPGAARFEANRTAKETDIALAAQRVEPQHEASLADLEPAAATRTGESEAERISATTSSVTTITGRVVDSDGLPLRDVTVLAFVGPLRPTEKRTRQWEVEVTSGQDGRFRIDCPRADAQQAALIASRPPYLYQALRSFGTGTHCQFPPLTVPRIDVGDVPLQRAGVLRGRVVNGKGVAVEGATVYVPNVWYSKVVTDADGSYVLTSIVAGEQYVTAKLDGHMGDGTPIDVAPDVETVVPLLVVRRGGVLHGRVVDPDGRPIAGAVVRNDAVCDGNGEFELAVGGTIAEYVRAGADGYRTSTRAAFELGVDAEITLHPLGRPARFDFVNGATGDVVRSPKIRRVSEREVPGMQPLGPSGLAGWREPQLREASDDLPRHWTALALPERDAVQAEAFGYVKCEVILGPEAFDGGVQTIPLTPVPMGPLTGTALVDGRPLQHAGVEVLEFEEFDLTRDQVLRGTVPAGEPVWHIKNRHRVFTDANGRFEYRGELPGPVQVVVRLANAHALVSKRVQPAYGETIDLGELQRMDLPSLAGTLAFTGELSAEIASTEYGTIELETQPDIEPVGPTALTAGGDFRFDGLLPGVHALRLDIGLLGQGGRGRIYLIDVPACDEHRCNLNVEIPSLATIELYLTVNGVPWDRDCYASLVERGVEVYLGTDFDEPANGRRRIIVPADRDYRLILDLAITDYDGTFEPAVQVVCPPGLSRLEVALEAAELMLTLPPDWEPEGWNWVYLEWTDAGGVTRLPIPAEKSLTAPIFRADLTVGHTVRFVSVPVDVTHARVVYRKMSSDDEEVVELGEVQLSLEAGTPARVVMK